MLHQRQTHPDIASGFLALTLAASIALIWGLILAI
jgi:hypothetical protein